MLLKVTARNRLAITTSDIDFTFHEMLCLKLPAHVNATVHGRVQLALSSCLRATFAPTNDVRLRSAASMLRSPSIFKVTNAIHIHPKKCLSRTNNDEYHTRHDAAI